MANVNAIEYPPYYEPYVQLVGFKNLFNSLESSINELLQYCNRLSNQQGLFKYAAGKWSIKEITQHLIDVERIFCYRALSISRGDTAFKSFDHNQYVISCNADYRPLTDLLKEIEIVRKSTIQLFNSFDTSMLQKTGFIENNNITANAIGFIIAGHQLHHTKIIKDRYLSVL